MTRRMTISEAAAELKVSTKTIKRRLQAGDLQGQLIAHRWIIDMPDEVVDIGPGEAEDSARSGSAFETEDKRDTRTLGQKGHRTEDKRDRTKGTNRTEGTSAELLRLEAELEEARRDKEWLKGKVDELTGMVDTLSNRTGEQASLIYHLQQRLLLAAPPEPAEQAQSPAQSPAQSQEPEPRRRSWLSRLFRGD